MDRHVLFEFIRVPYNIKKELERIDDNLEKDSYRLELEQGIYRDMNKIKQQFQEQGVKLRD